MEIYAKNQNGSIFFFLTTSALGLPPSPVLNDRRLAFWQQPSIYEFSYFPFGFEDRMLDLIVSVPDHCLSFYFEVKNRNRNKEISYQMHVLANFRYLLALKNTFELPCDDMSFIYLKIQAANLRAHILIDLNNENRIGYLLSIKQVILPSISKTTTHITMK